MIWTEPRSLFFFRTGRLRGAEGEEYCDIVALAESGAIVRASTVHKQGEAAVLELNSLHKLRGSVAWTDEKTLGLEFDDRLAVRKILSGRELSHPYRAPRLGVHCALEIRLGAQRFKVRSHDISEAGIKVELPLDCTGRDATVALEGLDPVAGRVKWWREGLAGVSFRRPIPTVDFTRWVTPRLE